MIFTPILRARRLGVAATAATFAVGLVTTGSAVATRPNAGAVRAGAAFASRSGSAAVANDTLTINGTKAPDAIALRAAAADPNVLQVDFGNDGTVEGSFDRSTFTAISVFLGAGDDQLIEQAGVFADKPLTVDAGSGNDLVVTGDANDLIEGGSGRDTINSGAGDDVILSGSGDDTVIGGIGHDTAFLGAGQDTFTWNPGDGSDVVDGGGGRQDTLAFNGAGASENMSLSANGPRAVFLRDVGNIRMDLDHIEDVAVNALGGADTVTVGDMSGTNVREADVDLSGTTSGVGDGQADMVTVNGTGKSDHVKVNAVGLLVSVNGLHAETRVRGSESALDHLQVNTLGGNDTIAVDPNTAAAIGVGVDLGSGQH